MAKRFYVTTPIYYVNSSPHVGTAYTTVLADAFTRFHAMRGERAHFLTGTDEHGLKLEREAKSRGQTPREFVDEMSARFRETWPKLDVLPNDFLRTTESRHEQRVQAMWTKCVEHGDIYLGSYEGLYCVGCEELKTEKELVDGNCPIHHRPVEKMAEPSYFFRLSNYTDRLLAFYESHPDFIQPETRRNEVLSFVREGLRDLAVSRVSFTWGIPVPGDPKHVMYVWFDALFNYLTALEDGPLRDTYWPPDLQLVGKDILRFHAVYWPAFLMSAGFEDALLPKTIFAHGFLLSAGRKFAKTQNAEDKPKRSPGTSDPTRIAEVLGADVYRYFIMREVAFGQDGEFSHEAMIARARSELAETVGNLLNRALPFAKHFEGRVPHVDPSTLTDTDRALIALAGTKMAEAAQSWESLAPHKALEATIELARAGNKYFDESAPWTLAKKGETARLAAVIYNVLELVREVSVALWPAIPRKSDELRAQLGLDALTPLLDTDLWPLTWGGLAAHSALAPGQPVFPKYDKLTEAALLKELGVGEMPVEAATSKAAEKPAETSGAQPATPEGLITYDDFAKVELTLGTVLSAERVPKKDMLLKLLVDLGEPAGPRTIIAGIAKAYAPEALVNKQIVVVANLAPRDFGKGLVSHGMLLACGPKESLSVVTVEKPMPAGTRVK